jgi:hypothetical protein
MKMHDRNDQDQWIPDLINDAKGKSVRSTASSSVRKRLPGIWITDNASQSSLDFCSELITETFAFEIVESNSLLQFSPGRLQELESHRVRLSILLNTSRAGIALIFPFSKASSLFSTSFAQRASIFLSEGNSKLDNSISISSARSMGGRSRALDKMGRFWGDIDRRPPYELNISHLHVKNNAGCAASGKCRAWGTVCHELSLFS